MGLFDFINLSNHINAPDWIKSHMEHSSKLPSSTPLDQVTFCSLDCETTGLEKDSEVITAGAVKLQGNKIKISDTLHLKFAVSKGQKQSEIHEELAQEATIENEAQLKKLLTYIGNAVIIGHHIAFDISKINQMIGKYHRGFALKNKSVDTFLMMKRIDPMRFERNIGALKSMKLEALCREFDIDVENRHTALGDAYLSAQLFAKLLARLKKRKVKTLRDL